MLTFAKLTKDRCRLVDLVIRQYSLCVVIYIRDLQLSLQRSHLRHEPYNNRHDRRFGLYRLLVQEEPRRIG